MSEHKQRITLSDTPMSAIMSLAEGNPGALTVLMRTMQEGGKIDPDAGYGEPFFIILSFDSLGLYGPKIWMLYKDVCKENLSKTLAMLRAWQLGFTTSEQVHHACDNHGAGLDVDALCARVKERLPNFVLTA